MNPKWKLLNWIQYFPNDRIFIFALKIIEISEEKHYENNYIYNRSFTVTGIWFSDSSEQRNNADG